MIQQSVQTPCPCYGKKQVKIFQEMVITVVISLVASLFVAITLVPALCGSILQINTRVQKPLKNKLN